MAKLIIVINGKIGVDKLPYKDQVKVWAAHLLTAKEWKYNNRFLCSTSSSLVLGALANKEEDEQLRVTLIVLTDVRTVVILFS